MANLLPAKLEPENVTAICDTREQLPLDLDPLRVQVGTLDTGDYSLFGCEHVVRVERKSLDDLLGCVGRERERFDREVMRLLAYPIRVLVVEATWAEVEMGQWRSKVTPEQAIGSLLGWQAAGLSIHMVGDHERAGAWPDFLWCGRTGGCDDAVATAAGCIGGIVRTDPVISQRFLR